MPDWEPTMEMQEGSPCWCARDPKYLQNDGQAPGELEFTPDGECLCHLNPPCHACSNPKLICNLCDLRVEEMEVMTPLNHKEAWSVQYDLEAKVKAYARPFPSQVVTLEVPATATPALPAAGGVLAAVKKAFQVSKEHLGEE